MDSERSLEIMKRCVDVVVVLVVVIRKRGGYPVPDVRGAGLDNTHRQPIALDFRFSISYSLVTLQCPCDIGNVKY